eukprot:CAMPEP_0118647842 /NCGR_PEP_ID=MMETSP0785-20121206/8829_1 /TAXON_ID=91992 /ORGANISM="Bolidomonas pacifica, Strain CCMP 1866" /LENGTH=548 /DNA_ID=CAMNT_0006539977 /DNA_START=100 /DNA_END=1743 /DNA_ORIENTATION=+
MDFSTFSKPPVPSEKQEDLQNPFAVIAADFKGYPADLSNLARHAANGNRSDPVFMGRMYKAYCVIHSAIYGLDKDASSDAVLRNLDSKFRVCCGDVVDVKVPRVRFGKTGLDISVITNGSMRYQQTWTQTVTSEAMIEEACQANLKRTILRALEMGINHFETARGYGSSEIQMGKAFKEIFEETEWKREDILIQTKVNPQDSNEKFIEELEKSFAFLQVDYVDLFSFHGLNKACHYEQLFSPGGRYEVIQDYVKRGKIRHVGFSTHGWTDLICKFIETDKFEYLNLHYHWCGSYTASGQAFPEKANAKAVRLAKERDMGIFIISPYDKGGAAYNSSRVVRGVCDSAGLDPLEFAVGWLVKEGAHTMTVGVGRSEDYDEPLHACYLLTEKEEEFMSKVVEIEGKLEDKLVEALGKEWMDTWWDGLPHSFETETAVDFARVVWAYNLMKGLGMQWFAYQRHKTGVGNAKNWDPNKTADENRKDWGYMPGLNPTKGVDYGDVLKGVREENFDRVKRIVEEEYLKLIELKEGDEGWNKGYESIDMRPWVAYP